MSRYKRDYESSITATLNRGWAELRRSKTIESTARALRFLLCTPGAERGPGDAQMQSTDVSDRVVALLPMKAAIQAKLDRESTKTRYEGERVDAHGPTVQFLEAWLFGACDTEGRIRLP